MKEDAPANSAGGGNIAGLGVGAKGEPGVLVGRQKKKVRDGQIDSNQQQSAVMAFTRRATPTITTGINMNESETAGSVAIGSFAGNQTFVIPSQKFNEMKLHKAKGKHWKKYIGEDSHGIAIREYARKNPGKAIILQDENTGAMCYARYGKEK